MQLSCISIRQMNIKLIGMLFAAAVLFVLVFVVRSMTLPKTDKSEKLQIAASFYPLYFFADYIGGGKADVFNITPAGVEPHDYEPTPKDIAKIEESSLLILNGEVEGWGDKLKENLKNSHTQIVTAGNGLFIDSDPHIWLDPILAKKEAQVISRAIISTDPANKDTYESNTKALQDRLDKLNLQYQAGLADCQNRDIITSHAAFGYVAARYNLNQVSIAGLSPDEEPSTQTLTKIADFARKNNVKYIFFESLVSPKLSQTIASEIGAKTLVLNPLEGLSDDDIKSGRDYFSVMQDNLKNLQVALQCQNKI